MFAEKYVLIIKTVLATLLAVFLVFLMCTQQEIKDRLITLENVLMEDYEIIK